MSKEGDFLVFCVEKYAEAKSLAPHEVLARLEAAGASAYIMANYEALHTVGVPYLIEDLDGFLAESGEPK